MLSPEEIRWLKLKHRICFNAALVTRFVLKSVALFLVLLFPTCDMDEAICKLDQATRAAMRPINNAAWFEFIFMLDGWIFMVGSFCCVPEEKPHRVYHKAHSIVLMAVNVICWSVILATIPGLESMPESFIVDWYVKVPPIIFLLVTPLIYYCPSQEYVDQVRLDFSDNDKKGCGGSYHDVPTRLRDVPRAICLGTSFCLCGCVCCD
jgi:hypothetical protein